jgi:hypothetical protein
MRGSNSQYAQNGIYDASKNTFSFSLPADMLAGSYQLSVQLISQTNERYRIELDDVVAVQ